MKKTLKITAITLAVLLGVLLLTVGGYVLYVVFQYDRIEDNLPLAVNGSAEETVPAGKELKIVTYNIGFGAYAQDFSFFMDSGRMLTGEKVSGKYSKAKDRATVEKNTSGAVALAKEQAADFYFFQEVDTDADRSRHVNQYEYIVGQFGD